MRGADITQESLFTVEKLDDFVPTDHPLRGVRTLVDTALKRLDGLFGTLYSDYGRAGEADARATTATVLLDSQRAAVDGAAALQPAVSLVCRFGYR